MPVTFALAMSYNQHYREAMKTVKAIWLDELLPSILQADGNKVRDELSMDGTHISPSYLPLVEQALQQALN
jgi:hypothetical protein